MLLFHFKCQVGRLLWSLSLPDISGNSGQAVFILHCWTWGTTYMIGSCLSCNLTIEQRSRLYYKVLCSRQFGEGRDGLLERLKTFTGLQANW